MKSESSRLSAETVSVAVVDVSLAQSAVTTPENWVALCDDVRRLVDSIAFIHGGVPVLGHQSNNEFAYAFGKASSAVEALVELHTQCLRPVPDHTGVSLRSAIYIGELGTSFQGTPLEPAVALKNIASVHQILVTLAVRELSKQQVSEGIDFRDLDTQTVSDSLAPQRVFQVLAPGLPSEFPPLRALDSSYTNLPFQVDGFIGREKEIFEIIAGLRTSRVVNLTGSAGIGKSRLALQLGRMMLHEYPDGVFVIDFEDLFEPSFIVENIASELPFVDRAGLELAQQIRAELASKQILVILDNCDYVQDALAKQAEILFGGLRGVDLIVTSRLPVGLTAQKVIEVPPLDSSTSEKGDQWEQSVALLNQRILDAVPGYSFDDAQKAGAVELCSLLRGVPLAIELVSTKLKVLSLQETCSQIAGILDVSRSRRQEDLHELVEKIVGLIYESLPEGEQKVFRRVSAFVAGWELPAAQHVCADPDLSEAQIASCINILVQKGLFRRQRKGPHRHRDSLVPSLRTFACALVDRAGEEASLRKRHLNYFLRRSAKASKELIGPKQHQELDNLNLERGNFRLAIEWSLNGGKNLQAAYDLVLGVHKFWYRRGLYTEGQIWLNRLLGDSGFEVSERRARALNVLGIFLTACGDNESALTYHEHSLDLGRKLELKTVIGSNLANMGTCYRGLKRLDEAIEAFHEGSDVLREAGEEQMLASSLSNFGACLSDAGRCDEAGEVLKESLELSQKLGNDWMALMVSFNLAQVAIRQNALDRAEPLIAQSMQRWFEQQDYRGVSMAFRSMAVLAEKLDQPDRAAVLLGASASLRNRLHQELPPFEVAYFQELSERLSSSIGEANFFKRWSEGNSLSAQAAVTFAAAQLRRAFDLGQIW
jgi:predicted ATPase